MHAVNHARERARSLARTKFAWLRQVCADPNLGHLSCRMAALLIDHVDVATGEAWPSQARLAEAAGVTPRAVQNALKSLRVSGHLKLRKLSGRTNRYRPVLLPANGGSSPQPAYTNGGSKTPEPSFARLHETPIKEARAEISREERRQIGEEMAGLARRLGGRRSLPGGRNV